VTFRDFRARFSTTFRDASHVSRCLAMSRVVSPSLLRGSDDAGCDIPRHNVSLTARSVCRSRTLRRAERSRSGVCGSLSRLPPQAALHLSKNPRRWSRLVPRRRRDPIIILTKSAAIIKTFLRGFSVTA